MEKNDVPKSSEKQNAKVDFLDLRQAIVERDVGLDGIPKLKESFTEAGFPEVKRFESVFKGKNKTQSLYSLMKKGVVDDSKNNDNKPEPMEVCDNNFSVHEIKDSKAGALGQNTDKEMAKIADENQEKIKKMSTKEIEETLKILRQKLTPESIEFLKNRSKKRQVETTEKVSNKKTEPDRNEIEAIKDKIPIPIEDLQSGKYPKITVESEKLEWIGDIPEDEDGKKTKQDYNTDDVANLQARFDFNGIIIDEKTSENITVKEGLHHHGDEPGRAGYTINELLLYVHSKFNSQRQIALKTFASIITNAYRGIYDNVFNHNLIEYLLKDSSLVLTVRLCLDDPSESIWKHSLQCFQAFICNTIDDEIFIDRGYLLFEDYLNFGFNIKLYLKPLLDENVHFDENVTDQQYIAHDLIDCLLQRTNILERFQYILQHNDDPVFAEIILNILIRFARHSKKISEMIIEKQDLIKIILKKYLIRRTCPIESFNECHLKTFKLLRILVTTIVYDYQDNTQDTDLYTLEAFLSQLLKLDLVKSLEYCLYVNPEDNCFNKSSLLLRIAVEGIRCWIKILSVNRIFRKELTIFKEFKSVFSLPSFIRILDYSSKLMPLESGEIDINRSFDFQFLSCLFVLCKIYFDILKPETEAMQRVLFPRLVNISQFWLSVLDHNSFIPDFDSSLCILVLIEFILENIPCPESIQIGALTLKLMNNNTFIRKMFYFLIESTSSVDFQNSVSGNQRDAANLPSFGSIYFRKFKSISLFNQDSCICLLLCLMKIEERYRELFDKNRSLKTVQQFVRYISIVERNIHANYEANIFDLIEIHIVSYSCLSVRNYFLVNPEYMKIEDAKVLIKFATLINVINATPMKAKLIVQILFEPKIWSIFGYEFHDKNFEHFKAVYSKLSPFCDQFWLFHPLLNMIDFKVEKDSKRQPIPVEDVLSCLKYIQLFLQCFPEYFKKMNVQLSAFFMLICSVFFFPDLLFFDADIDRVLRDILIFLLDYKGGIVVKKDDVIPHIGNSIDFFERLLTEFEFSSMGNVTFCNYILVFVQRKCSPEFKHAFLSNHSTDIERTHLMSITLEELLVPMTNFLSPIETEPNIIDLYFRCLGCPSVTPENSPVLYCIMIHHVHHAIFHEQSDFNQKLDNNQKKRFDWLLNSFRRTPARLQKHLKFYDHYDSSSEFGIVLKEG